MSNENVNDNRVGFGSKIGALLAAAGSAVGLGNIWRFPTEMGSNGGSAFLLVYIICILIFGIPLLLSEFVIGRRSRANVGNAYSVLAPNTHWKLVGYGSVLVSFVIFCYYNVVIGWVLYYLYEAVSGNFVEIGQIAATTDLSAFKNHFISFVSHDWKPVLCLGSVLLMMYIVIILGVKKGIERTSKLLVPTLFIIMILLAIFAIFMPGAKEGYEFMFSMDFSKITPKVALAALAQCFYSFSLGMGLITYASYFKRKYNLGKTALSIAGMDTLVAILAGVIIFPAVFSNTNAEPSSGAGLVFISLPGVFESAFQSYPFFNWAFSVAFYFILLVAALTSSIFLQEVSTAFMIENWHMSRAKSATIITVLAFAIGSVAALSFGPLSHITLFDMNIFDLLDYTTSKLILPLTGLGGALFIGWRLSKVDLMDELTSGGLYKFLFIKPLLFLVRYVIPVLIITIMVTQLLS